MTGENAIQQCQSSQYKIKHWYNLFVGNYENGNWNIFHFYITIAKFIINIKRLFLSSAKMLKFFCAA